MKKNILSKTLFFYSAIASFFVTVSAALTSKTLGSTVFVLLFLPVAAYFVIEFFKTIRASFSKKSPEGPEAPQKPKKGEAISIAVIFLILASLGVRNVIVNSTKKVVNPPVQQKEAEATPSPLVIPTQEKTQTREIEIVIKDGSSFINVRQKPTIYSEILGEAKPGERYEYTQIISGWYEIKFKDEILGYISSKYANDKEPE